MATYPYRKLNLPHETRVLTFQPGKFTDDITCSLSHIKIASPDEPYEALSYCWSKGIDRDPGIGPDDELPWAVYGKDEDEQLIEKGGTLKFKDLVDHPYMGETYIRLGGKMPDAPIICDGVTVVVGGELFRALRRLREEDGVPLRIWVDALCINQQDISERNEHVKIMRQIYAGASRTRVWLGESTEMDFHAFRTLMAISDVFDDLYKKGLFEIDMSVPQFQWLFEQTANTERLDWGLLSEMLNRAWFKRTWIIQEVANSKDISVHIGGLSFGWTFLSSVIRAIQMYKLQSTIVECKALKTIAVMEQLRQKRIDESAPFSTMPLLGLLEELRDFNATIPSDKIYGVLGLTERKDEFLVDYAQSAEKLFTDFAVRELHAGHMDVLTHCVDSSKPTTLKLPSWVPDWTCPGWTEPLRIRGLEMKAAGNTKPELSIDGDGTILRIRGRILDKVAAIEMKRRIPPPKQAGPMDPADDEDGDWSKFEMSQYGGPILDAEPERSPPSFFAWQPANKVAKSMSRCSGDDAETDCTESQEVTPEGTTRQHGKKTPKDARYRYMKIIEKTREDAKAWHLGVVDVAFPDKKVTPRTWENLWRTFMYNRTRENERPRDGCATGFDVYLKTMTLMEGPEGILQQLLADQIDNHGLSLRDADSYYLQQKENLELVIGANAKWSLNRRFFRSDAGRFGWCVDGTQPGDIVALFHGCDSVFTLREAGDGGWRIIGDCYIHDLMDGEGVRPDFEETELQII
ncbi:Heterokaryon incompatibility protein 6, OR allele [Colletotrichum aenigma]|uniref:Heterokaryon incompatibility protein 6, OR allele n=1 Tax=Colletotrichum aenigma TaxID=1215731 RepID=UPI001872ED7D|nr:Heterokaryon incompatibility protein 6, OR allele [Colletotrichum aenigma]KAF5520640.1 Heterokaryon incompatibility protein 6, OR allele [Colletotrichum aenigma]